jgi:hypothetical protein
LSVVPTPLAPTLYPSALDDPGGLSRVFGEDISPGEQNMPLRRCREPTDAFKRIITTLEENGTVREYLEGTKTKTPSSINSSK